MRLFRNRRQAGRLLARKLSVYKNKHPLVLGIPRGAVPMAKVIADALGGDLDVVLVHKLSHPEELELAIGAIDDSGNAILTDYAAEWIRISRVGKAAAACSFAPASRPVHTLASARSILKVALSSWLMMASLRARQWLRRCGQSVPRHRRNSSRRWR